MANNPAGRLHDVLRSALGNQLSDSMQVVWAKVLKVPDSDVGEILNGITVVLQQISLAKVQIRAIDGADHDLYLRPIEKIEKTFAHMNLGEQLKQFSARLDPVTLDSLAYTSEFLRLAYPQNELKPKDLGGLMKGVEALGAEVRKAKIDESLKNVMTEHVERLRRAILEYDLRGPEGIIETLDANLGFVIRTGVSEDLDEETESLYKRFCGSLLELYATVSAATGLFKLGAGAAKEILKLTARGG